jgi:rhomboid protease GluP
MNQKRKSAILCPNCRKLISRDESHCPHCHLANPGSRWKTNSLARALRSAEIAIPGIIYLNIAMYLFSLLLNPASIRIPLHPFHFLSPDNQVLLLLGATGVLPIDSLDRWWSLISANYLHGSIMHIAFNMVAFRQLASVATEVYGSYRMVVVYTFGGILGFFISYLAGVQLTIGASAAVCGLMGALLYYGKSRGGVYGQMVYKQISGWVIGIFLLGFLLPGINNWGHGGGLIVGICLAFLLGYQEKRHENRFHKVLYIVAAAATIGTLLWALLSTLILRFS